MHCLTTHPYDVPEPIFAYTAIHESWRGFWSKVELFRPGLFEFPVLFLDLDTIVNNLDSLPSTDIDGMWMIRDVGGHKRWASGVMAWHPGRGAPFYHDLMKWREERHYPVQNRRKSGNRDRCSYNAFPNKGDQEFMHRRAPALGVKFSVLQQQMRITSFKKGVRKYNKNPDDYDIICFHGKPRPQNCTHPWVVDYFQKLSDVPL